ncbi:carboxy terminal-processing peptidase [Desulfobulbus alkaliphilus]|uniref:carboxy terminal-processing peptidase n=1 Tax=Desulfobulbus alkaliphilus TaxID=869814 RepID=UPI001964F816|nr:carboxy terminal-processing peptidase [Desulfobulbus alkaliphilus]MBM9536646.1 carboxy terminal-processing peptidase [Desulfobulbus alkaliphilus]
MTHQKAPCRRNRPDVGLCLYSSKVFVRAVFSSLVTTLLLLALASGCLARTAPPSFDEDRNRLIAFILSQQLPNQHFGHESLDDTFSHKAFDLYLRQLDPRKRFLLQSDVSELSAFSSHISNELARGRLVLADAGMDLLNDRINQVQRFIDPVLDQGFDLERKEYLEIDPKKLDYAKNIDDLRERWRLSLKIQVLDTYIEALIAQGKQHPEALAHLTPKYHPAEYEEAVQKVRASTHRSLNRLLQQTRQDHYDRYFNAVTRAFDPHTDYMPPTSKEDFDIQMSGSLEGIGALLREDEGLIKVMRIIPGSAAEKEGQLQAEDIILAVAEKNGAPVDISEMRIREAVRYIRGPKGTEVRLTVQKPDGAKRIITIVRDVVRIEESYVQSFILEGENDLAVGYLRIPSFYRDFAAQNNGRPGRNVTDDTKAELLHLRSQNIGGLILDLRNNGGGALTDAVTISGLFLPGGPIVQVKDSLGSIRVMEDEESDVIYDGPLIVLVNQFSASASEILAAALQDYGRALIVGGEHTHGKGTVQALLDMNKNLPLLNLRRHDDLGALKLTIQKFYRISGGSTQYKGVEPDLVFPSPYDHIQSGERFMEHSLPWDQVEDVPFTPWSGVRFDTRKAEKMGRQWAATNELFLKIQDETNKARERGEQTRMAVALETMWQERQELATARREARIAGLLEDEQDPDTYPDESIDLEQRLAQDPFVQISLFLINNAIKNTGTVARTP